MSHREGGEEELRGWRVGARALLGHLGKCQPCGLWAQLPQTPTKAAGGPACDVRPGLLTKKSVALRGPWTKVLIGEKPREEGLPQ